VCPNLEVFFTSFSKKESAPHKTQTATLLYLKTKTDSIAFDLPALDDIFSFLHSHHPVKSSKSYFDLAAVEHGDWT
jgi:hypothetical protein